MIPAITAVRLTGARNRAELPLLVLGPAEGTSATTLWSGVAAHLADVFDVAAWDLPGHGHNRSVPGEQFSMADLAAGVLRVVDDVLTERGEVGKSFFYAGDSVGGAVGLQLMLDAPERVASAVLLCTEARLDESAALAAFDVRDRLAEIDAPVLFVADRVDTQASEGVARLMREHLLGEIFADIDGVGSVLDERSRSLARLTVMLVRGQEEQLVDELRRAEAHGVSTDEIVELRLLVEELA